MSIGSILVGISVLVVVVAYLAQPFRSAAGAGSDRTIEAWVAQVETADDDRMDEGAKIGQPEMEGKDINFCPKCGRKVDEDDRFCSGCGTRLRGDVA